MKTKLTSYLNKIEAKYIKAREDWERIQKKLIEEEQIYRSTDWGKLSPIGRTEVHNRHNETRKGILKEFEDLRENFSQEVQKIEADSDKVFNSKYSFESGAVDLKGMALLQSGALGIDELINLAESYRTGGNMTMYFLVADKLKQDKPLKTLDKKEQNAKSYYEEAQKRKNREDHELLENFGGVCLQALRDVDYLSNGIHNVHDEFYQKAKAEAEEIFVEHSAPWD